MGDYTAKAQDLVKRADKKLNSFGLFGFGSKYEDAADLYEKAANQFKLAKACEHLLVLSFNTPSHLTHHANRFLWHTTSRYLTQFGNTRRG